MPHFVIDCSKNILANKTEIEVLKILHETANSSGLFAEEDIKVRMNPYSTYLVGGDEKDFIHVFASIMGGRTREQKAELSRAIIAKLIEIFPQVPYIAMNVDDFEKATYCNRRMI